MLTVASAEKTADAVVQKARSVIAKKKDAIAKAIVTAKKETAAAKEGQTKLLLKNNRVMIYMR